MSSNSPKGGGGNDDDGLTFLGVGDQEVEPEVDKQHRVEFLKQFEKNIRGEE